MSAFEGLTEDNQNCSYALRQQIKSQKYYNIVILDFWLLFLKEEIQA
jgi:hypothetical protein